MAEKLQHNEWSGKTDGQPWMQRSLIVMFRMLPIAVMYGFMAIFIVPFYIIFNRKGYNSTYTFFRKRFKYGRFKSFCKVYANHFRFGQIILDRFGVYAGKKYKFDIEGQDFLDELESHPEGFVLLSSHVGNYEIAGYSMKTKAKKFNALVYAGETATVMENRRRILSQNNMNMIPVMADMSHLFALNSAIDNGEIVSMPADRIFGSQKAAECTFFGETARFPLGAFALSAQKNVPVLAIFIMKESTRKYHAYIRKIQCDRSAKIREQMNEMAQNFAENLEEIVRKYPTQWFNYFDFWKQ